MKPIQLEQSFTERTQPVNAQSDPGVVFKSFSASQQSILSPYCSINYLRQKLEAFQSVHHVVFILCYTVLEDYLSLVFAFIRVRKYSWDNIIQGKQ